MARNQFIDPRGVRPTYNWAINHSEEDNFGRSRNIEYTARTGEGLVMQQGDEPPVLIRIRGTILTKAQVQEMIAWYTLCKEQTIYFKDFAGDEYEVLITSFQPTRQRNVGNLRDQANAPYWHWTYEMQMDVVTVRSGVWV